MPHYPAIAVQNPVDHLMNGSPTGMFRESYPRRTVISNLSAFVSGQMTCSSIALFAGEVVTNLTFLSGNTAAGTPTNWWFALYDTQATPALISQTADQTTTAWAANTPMTLALSSPYTVPVTGAYYATCMVAATTVPTMAGFLLENIAAGANIVGSQKILSRQSGSSLTTTAPATISSPTSKTAYVYVVAT